MLRSPQIVVRAGPDLTHLFARSVLRALPVRAATVRDGGSLKPGAGAVHCREPLQ